MSRFWLWLALCAGPACAALQPTTTTLTLDSGTPVYGAALNFRAKVTAQAGSITFTVDGVSQSPIPLDVNSGATLRISTFLPGSHTIGASFVAGAIYAASAATPLTVTVTKAPTLIGMSATPAQIGQPVVITATVSIAGNGTFSGTVGFAPAPECGAVQVQFGLARCTVTFSATGTFPVYASFSGDDNTTVQHGQHDPHGDQSDARRLPDHHAGLADLGFAGGRQCAGDRCGKPGRANRFGDLRFRRQDCVHAALGRRWPRRAFG